jgi:hypothetical protein
MLKRRFENLITNPRHRVTNAKIQWVKYAVRRFRNRQSLANAIYFHWRPGPCSRFH